MHIQAGQCGNQIGAKVSSDFIFATFQIFSVKFPPRYDKICIFKIAMPTSAIYTKSLVIKYYMNQ